MNDLRRQRETQYGDSHHNQYCLSKTWTAILESHFQQRLDHDIPPHVVADMLVALKLLRSSMPTGYRADDYADAHVYLTIADELEKGSKK